MILPQNFDVTKADREFECLLEMDMKAAFWRQSFSHCARELKVDL